ncbi:MAG: GNAT family N-acetyltransferase [Syntrophobacterales bacterium]|jgi:GNAT superfamily N-acetyltransferase|nr:GNAT family N-acetyltransferase [Syntrophobacterales bacterium]
MIIRKASADDAGFLWELYANHLTDNPPAEEQDMEKWKSMLAKFLSDRLYYLFVGEMDNMAVSSVTLIIIENLTNNMRPYAIIENVVTHAGYRGRGFASALMQKATETAREHNCYKIMLMTGSKKESTLNFYRNNGFDMNEKTAFIKRL